MSTREYLAHPLRLLVSRVLPSLVHLFTEQQLVIKDAVFLAACRMLQLLRLVVLFLHLFLVAVITASVMAHKL